MKTQRKKEVPIPYATYLTVIANEDEICVAGFKNKTDAQDRLDERFQRALPEELTTEYLASYYEDMNEFMAENRYVDDEDYEEISKKYLDAKSRSFDYGDAYTNGSYACYMPAETKLVNGQKIERYEFGMIGNVYKRDELNGRYIVLWNDEAEIYQAGFRAKKDADKKLKEVFTAAVPAEMLKDITLKEKIEKMEVDEKEIGLMDDIAFCTLSNPVFNAIILDIGQLEAAINKR